MSEREGISASYCCARNCSNRRDTSNLFFFQVPSDKKRAKRWLSACGRKDLIEHLGSLHGLRLCSAHFEDDLFESDLKDRLVEDAVPTILEGEFISNVEESDSEEEHSGTTDGSDVEVLTLEVACSSSQAEEQLKSSETAEVFTEFNVKEEEKCLPDIAMVPTDESFVETAAIKTEETLAITPLSGTTQSKLNLGVEEHLKSSKLLSDVNIKSEEDDMELNTAEGDDEFKEECHEVTRVSDVHIDMFFESMLGAAKTLTKENQIILTDKLKEIVNEYC